MLILRFFPICNTFIFTIYYYYFFYDFTNFFLPDPLKRIEIFKAVTSPAYIVATLENVNDVSSDFFCPVKKCFEFAVEASAKGKAMPEYKREYREIEQR